MSNTKNLQKATALWVSIVWAVCYLGVLIFPNIRATFALYALHMTTSVGENVLTYTTFLSGLVIWNVLAWLAVSLFAYLLNKTNAQK